MAERQINPPVSDAAKTYYEAFKAKYPDGNISQARITNVIEMLARAINDAGSATDVVKIADALEGMEHDNMWGFRTRRVMVPSFGQKYHGGLGAEPPLKHGVAKPPWDQNESR